MYVEVLQFLADKQKEIAILCGRYDGWFANLIMEINGFNDGRFVQYIEPAFLPWLIYDIRCCGHRIVGVPIDSNQIIYMEYSRELRPNNPLLIEIVSIADFRLMTRIYQKLVNGQISRDDIAWFKKFSKVEVEEYTLGFPPGMHMWIYQNSMPSLQTVKSIILEMVDSNITDEDYLAAVKSIKG